MKLLTRLLLGLFLVSFIPTEMWIVYASRQTNEFSQYQNDRKFLKFYDEELKGQFNNLPFGNITKKEKQQAISAYEGQNVPPQTITNTQTSRTNNDDSSSSDTKERKLKFPAFGEKPRDTGGLVPIEGRTTTNVQRESDEDWANHILSSGTFCQDSDRKFEGHLSDTNGNSYFVGKNYQLLTLDRFKLLFKGLRVDHCEDVLGEQDRLSCTGGIAYNSQILGRDANGNSVAFFIALFSKREQCVWNAYPK